jgi:hypothetical protein
LSGICRVIHGGTVNRSSLLCRLAPATNACQNEAAGGRAPHRAARSRSRRG